jgi:hypothetical protein
MFLRKEVFQTPTFSCFAPFTCRVNHIVARIPLLEDSENRNDLRSKVEVFDMFTTPVVFSFSQAGCFFPLCEDEIKKERRDQI